jgi:macrolide transport system ATP-binding/permease protein
VETTGGRDRPDPGDRPRERLNSIFWRRRGLDDFKAEIESHLQLEIDRLQAEGLSADDARGAAHRAFGNVTISREAYYEAGRWPWWDRLWQR